MSCCWKDGDNQTGFILRDSLKRGFIEKGYLRIVVSVIENVANKFSSRVYLGKGCFSY